MRPSWRIAAKSSSTPFGRRDLCTTSHDANGYGASIKRMRMMSIGSCFACLILLFPREMTWTSVQENQTKMPANRWFWFYKTAVGSLACEGSANVSELCGLGEGEAGRAELTQQVMLPSPSDRGRESTSALLIGGVGVRHPTNKPIIYVDCLVVSCDARFCPTLALRRTLRPCPPPLSAGGPTWPLQPP